jgi:hypothetical protein
LKKITIVCLLFLVIVGLIIFSLKGDYQIISANELSSSSAKTTLINKDKTKAATKIDNKKEKESNKLSQASLECLSLENVKNIDDLYQKVSQDAKLDIIKYQNFKLSNEKGERFVFTETTEFNENKKKVKKLSLYLIDESGIPELVKSPFTTNYISKVEMDDFLSGYNVEEAVIGKGLSTQDIDIDVETINGNVSTLNVQKNGKVLTCYSATDCKCEL